MTHLLKWQYQPGRRGSSSRNSIVVQRDRIPALLRQSPSLRRYIIDDFDELYRRAVVMAAGQTTLPDSTFPDRCPYSFEQVLNPKFYPE